MQLCSDCKNEIALFASRIANSQYCTHRITRVPVPHTFCDYEDCPGFEQESSDVVASCSKCAWREDKTCVLHKYPVKRWTHEHNGCWNKMPIIRKTCTWNVVCDSPVDDEHCQCFLISNDPRNVYQYQKKCCDHNWETSLNPNIPRALIAIELDQARELLDIDIAIEMENDSEKADSDAKDC